MATKMVMERWINYCDGLTIAAKVVMERWTNYGGEDGDGAKLQVSRRWSTVVEPRWRYGGGDERGGGGAGARWR